MSGTGTDGYGPPILRQRLMATAIGAAVVVIVVHTALSILGIVYVGELVTPPDGWQLPYDAVFVGGLWLRNLAILTAGVFYVAWQRRVTRNLLPLGTPALQPGLAFSTFSWIIPFANLIVPFHNVKQVATESAPDGERSAAALAGRWWASWVVGSIGMVTAGALYTRADDSGSWIVATCVLWIAHVLVVSSGLLVIFMSARISRHQEQRIAQLRVAAEPPPERPSS